MAWLFIALAAHSANGFVFIIDKILLGGRRQAFSPLTYALYSSLFGGLVIVLLPWTHFTSFLGLIPGLVLASAWHLLGLIFFFKALTQDEVSRVVPIVGSLVPLFTAMLGIIFLGSAGNAVQLLSIALLIGGGALVSIHFPWQRFNIATSVLMLGAGLFFASFFITLKVLYGTASFLTVLVYSRLLEALLAALLLTPIMLGAKRVRKKKAGRLAPSLLFVGNKALAGSAALLQQYAISIGSVILVNALQGVQYVAIFLVAAAISVWFPRLFREELKAVALGQKSLGIICISLGLFLLAFHL
jgi:uncharacterized membrane protein